MKKVNTKKVFYAVKNSELKPIKGIHNYSFEWIEPNKRRDPDNIIGGMKFIFDGLQMAGIISNDGWKDVGDIGNYFSINKGSPGIVVRIWSNDE